MSTIKGKLIFATVAEDSSGIHLRMQTDKNELKILFLPVGEQMGDISLILKPDMNAKKELQKVCDLLNGFSTDENGNVYPIEGFTQKTITLKTKEQE